MAADPINANPTILNASDLPTRRRPSPAHGSHEARSSLLASVISPASFLEDPFVDALSPSSASGGDDGDAIELIDEQEIYGMFERLLCSSDDFLFCLTRYLDSRLGFMRHGLRGSILFCFFSVTVRLVRAPAEAVHDLDRDNWEVCFLIATIHQPDENTLSMLDLISTISDPEHPLSLGSLAVVSLSDIHVSPPRSSHSPISTVTVLITPTITHCSLATVIGLGVRVRLEQALPPRFRVDVRIKEGTHSTADQVTKQLNDKERVAAALENGTLMGVLNKMLETCK